MNAESFLLQSMKISRRIVNLQNEIEELHDKMGASSIRTDREFTTGSRNTNSLETRMLKMMEKENELEKTFDELMKKREEIENVIYKLSNVKQYDVLYKLFILEKTVKQTAQMMGCSVTYVRTLKSQGMEEVQKILDAEYS
jgi:DNA-directed RNA polymerase specialized sigma24 family protein